MSSISIRFRGLSSAFVCVSFGSAQKGTGTNNEKFREGKICEKQLLAFPIADLFAVYVCLFACLFVGLYLNPFPFLRMCECSYGLIICVRARMHACVC